MFFHLVEAFLHQRPYDIDMLDYSVLLHASPIGFNTIGTKVWHHRTLVWCNDPSFFYIPYFGNIWSYVSQVTIKHFEPRLTRLFSYMALIQGSQTQITWGLLEVESGLGWAASGIVSKLLKQLFNFNGFFWTWTVLNMNWILKNINSSPEHGFSCRLLAARDLAALPLT